MHIFVDAAECFVSELPSTLSSCRLEKTGTTLGLPKICLHVLKDTRKI